MSVIRFARYLKIKDINIWWVSCGLFYMTTKVMTNTSEYKLQMQIILQLYVDVVSFRDKIIGNDILKFIDFIWLVLLKCCSLDTGNATNVRYKMHIWHLSLCTQLTIVLLHTYISDKMIILIKGKWCYSQPVWNGKNQRMLILRNMTIGDHFQKLR